MNYHRIILTVFVISIGLEYDLQAQHPPMRQHSANKTRKLKLMNANQSLDQMSRVAEKTEGGYRYLTVNSIPKHKVGRFPNAGNPNSIKEQRKTYRVPLLPVEAKNVRSVGLRYDFGIGVNGVPFDPGAAEFWMGRPDLNWQYEALGGAVALGLDENLAHVQPTGAYHYHGIPKGLLLSIRFNGSKHSPLIGWAADGFPIYVLSGYSDPRDKNSKIKTLRSSYRLKEGKRPQGQSGPGGKYDGTFVNDYEFVKGLGDLDECNGRFCLTPEFPNGTYAYFLTEHWPTIPRLFRGTPDPSFQKMRGPNGGPRGQNRGRPPHPPGRRRDRS